MIFAPGSFASTSPASSAVAKSPGHELAAVVDEEAPVGVAVERDAEIGALLERLRTMNSRFSGSSGFGSWFGNDPSGSK